MRVLSFDVGECPRISSRDFYVDDGDFVRPRVFWQLPIQRDLVPQTLWRPHFWLLLFRRRQTTFAFMAFGVAKDGLGKDGR